MVARGSPLMHAVSFVLNAQVTMFCVSGTEYGFIVLQYVLDDSHLLLLLVKAESEVHYVFFNRPIYKRVPFLEVLLIAPVELGLCLAQFAQISFFELFSQLRPLQQQLIRLLLNRFFNAAAIFSQKPLLKCTLQGLHESVGRLVVFLGDGLNDYFQALPSRLSHADAVNHLR